MELRECTSELPLQKEKEVERISLHWSAKVQLLATHSGENLSEGVVIGTATKSRSHAFPAHNSFLQITARARLLESCVSGRLHASACEALEEFLNCRFAGSRRRSHPAEFRSSPAAS